MKEKSGSIIGGADGPTNVILPSHDRKISLRLSISDYFYRKKRKESSGV